MDVSIVPFTAGDCRGIAYTGALGSLNNGGYTDTLSVQCVYNNTTVYSVADD